LKVHGTDRSLELEVEQHFRSNAVYSNQCEGQRFELDFLFRVEGEPSYDPVVRTRFRPPNRFVIVTQPLRPSIDPIPIDRSAPKK
jgi:hypothetical protein